MIGFGTNGGNLGRRYHKRAAAVRRGARAGLKRIVDRVDLEQAKNLRGGADAPPGSYPVPIRTGNLFQSRFGQVVNDHLAVAGNAAAYAGVIHKTRPFLSDAVDAVDMPLEMSRGLEEEVYAV